MISIIVLTYNSNIEKTLLTINSILHQSFNDYEIVISDDASLVDDFEKIKDYFNSIGFDDYIFNKLERNVGTVKNIISACKIANGKYIKPIGSGDLFFDENSLSEIYEFMEDRQSLVAFGGMQSYRFNVDDIIEYSNFYAPKYLQPYLNNDLSSIKKNIIILGDWISGATLFYNKDYILPKFEQLSECVTYCEDLAQVLVVVEGDRIDFLHRNILWYEVGNGVSTSSSNNSFSDKLKKDHVSICSYISERYPDVLTLKVRSIIENTSKYLPLNIFKKIVKGIICMICGCYYFSFNKKSSPFSSKSEGFLSKSYQGFYKK